MTEKHKVRVEFQESGNPNYPDVYTAIFMPTPAGVRGCPLGRSSASTDGAVRDLVRRVAYESKISFSVDDFDLDIRVERPESKPITSLEELKAAMMIDDCHVTDRHGGWRTDLKTFGGVDPESTIGVWSWDETRLLVGSCADDLEIVERPAPTPEIVVWSQSARGWWTGTDPVKAAKAARHLARTQGESPRVSVGGVELELTRCPFEEWASAIREVIAGVAVTLKTIEGARYTGTLIQIWIKLAEELSVGEPRSITVAESWEHQEPIGATVRASLYDGDDEITDADGNELDVNQLYQRAIATGEISQLY